MKVKHKIIFVVFIVSLVLAACSSQTAYDEETWAYVKEKSMTIPGSFTFDDDNKFARPAYSENCDNTIPYLAEHGANQEYSGYVFDSIQISSESNIQFVDNTEISVAKAEFLITLSNIKIENHTVNLKEQTVYFEDGSNGQVLDPALWLQKANEISQKVPVTKVTVSYIRNHMFNPNFSEAEWYERIYWSETIVSCTTTNP